MKGEAWTRLASARSVSGGVERVAVERGGRRGRLRMPGRSKGLAPAPARLHGGVVESPDIRAGMGLLIAALGAEGRSEIYNVGQIERGYERIDERLRALGAAIERFDSRGPED